MQRVPGGRALGANTGASMAAPQQRPQQQQRWTGACAPAPRRDDMVPWSAVEEALAMARVALDAKQRVAEVGPLGTRLALGR